MNEETGIQRITGGTKIDESSENGERVHRKASKLHAVHATTRALG